MNDFRCQGLLMTIAAQRLWGGSMKVLVRSQVGCTRAPGTSAFTVSRWLSHFGSLWNSLWEMERET